MESSKPSQRSRRLSGNDSDEKDDYKLIDMINGSTNPGQILYRILPKEEFKPPVKKAD